MLKNKASLIAMTLTILASSLTSAQATTPSSPSNSSCSLPGVILGTPGDDVILGTSDSDVICGLGGNDKIDGLGGDDIIFGGEGDDLVRGGDGGDQIDGGIGSDEILGGGDDDQLWGQIGDDTLIGEIGDDYVFGGPGSDNLFGSEGFDQLLGEIGDDSLNGGPDADNLDGGLGKNVCAKQADDTVQKCFFDNKGPQLINIAISPDDTAIDSTAPERKLHFRFTVKDPGTGADQISFLFARDKNYKYFLLPETSAVYEARHYEDVILSSGRLKNAPSCNESNSNLEGFCRLSGTSTFGLYQAVVKLPRNLATDSYRLVEFSSSDEVSNSTGWDAKTIKAKKLAISFSQTGTNDRVAPTVLNFEIVGDRNLTSSTLSPLYAKVSFTDEGNNGLGILTADFQLLKKTSHSFFSSGTSTRTDLQNICPENLNAIQRSCLVEGTPDSGIAIVRMSVNGWGVGGGEQLSRGLAKLTKITATDLVGNKRTYSKLVNSVVKANIVYEGFGFVTDNDNSPPSLISLTASSDRIDTSSAGQQVRYKMIAKDVGKGLNIVYSGVMVNRYLSDGSYYSVNYCKTDSTKTLTQGKVQFNIVCDFPPHFASGTYKLEVGLMDQSSQGNTMSYDSNQLQALNMPFELRNG
jgi:hypothetical protein